ncbi:hypothetical protein KIN20_034485 [Parelaphostrongylus tenuis]|uniref:Uncharacterized protein n=1 Tax=Parelaphostrongylus tenuis TaxID=148309 RepID=A0AAD5RAE6_PARTN|nr:hypothetical protein KIN20_034485 [Parelaphostrongylus tenuis]
MWVFHLSTPLLFLFSSFISVSSKHMSSHGASIISRMFQFKQLREVNVLSDLEKRGQLLANLRLVSDELHPLTGRTVVLRRVFLDHHKLDHSKIFRAGKAAFSTEFILDSFIERTTVDVFPVFLGISR